MRRYIAALSIGAAAFAAVPARAATYTVNVTNNTFDPSSRVATAGDTVRFWWASGQHTATAYEGASFDSGVRSAGFEMSVPFTGTTVKYRCTLHSQVSQFGACNGMCGVISATAGDLTPPAIAIGSPTQREVVTPTPSVTGGGIEHPVAIGGTASDNDRLLAIFVRIYDTLGQPRDVGASCPGCGSAVSTFEVRQDLLPGSYVAEATAIDASGNRRTSERVSFLVL